MREASELPRTETPARTTALIGLFLLLFTSGGVLYTLGAAVGSALFISSLPRAEVARTVPWVYVGAALANVGTALIYDRLLARVSRMIALLATQLLLAAFFSGSMLLWVSESASHYYVLTVGLDAASLLSLTLFFGFAGDYFNAGEARRVYGYIAGGLALGTVIGGEGLSWLLPYVSVPNLVHVCAGVLAINALLCALIGRLFLPSPSLVSSPRAPREAAADGDVSFGVLLKNPFVVLVWLTFLVGMLLTVASAFQMQWIASVKPRAELAAFFGEFYRWVGLGELAFQFLLVPLLLRVLGVLGALLLPPVLVGLVSLLMQSASAVSQLGGTHLGYSATVNGVRLTLEETLSLPARELLFLPLPARLRSRAQTIGGAVIAPLTRGAAGLLLLLYVGAGYGALELSSVVTISASVLILLLLRLRSLYRRALFESLRASGLGGTDLVRLLDAQGADSVLSDLLHSKDPAVLLYTLELLGQRRMPTLVPAARALTQHPSAAVAARAVEFLGAQESTDLIPVLEAALAHRSPAVASAAALALARTARQSARATLVPLLESPERSLADAALVALARQLMADDVALPRVRALCADPSPRVRGRGIMLVERIARAPYGELLAPLLASRDVNERRAAARAAAHCGCLTLSAPLLDRLAHGELSVLALSSLGISLLPELLARLRLDPPAAEHRNYLRALAHLPHRDAVSALCRALSAAADVLTRVVAAEGLYALTREQKLEPQAQVLVEQLIERECNAIELLLECYRQVARHDPDVGELLHEHADVRVEVVLVLCGIYVAADEYERLRASLASGSAERRSAALELLDTALPRKLASRVGRVVAEQHGEAAAEGRPLSEARLTALTRLGTWPAAIVARHAQHCGADPQRWLADDAARMAYERMPEVLFLNRVPLFRPLATDYLFEVVQAAERIELSAQQSLFERGDEGDAFFLVCEGAVTVHRDGQTIARVVPGEPLGELALLDGEPRSASARADQPTRLLKLGSDRFNALLDAEPALRRALMRTLHKRLTGRRDSRAVSHEVLQLSEPPPKSAVGLSEFVSALGILRESSLFRGLPQDCLIKVAACARSQTRFANELVYESGAPSDALFVVCTGLVAISDGQGGRWTLARGSSFGESALLAAAPRDHEARVVETCQLLRVHAAKLNRLLDEEADVGVALLRHFAARLRAGAERHGIDSPGARC